MEELRESGTTTQRGVTVLYRFSEDSLFFPISQYNGEDGTHSVAVTAENHVNSGWNKNTTTHNNRLLYYAENGVDAWLEKGYQIAFDGNIE